MSTYQKFKDQSSSSGRLPPSKITMGHHSPQAQQMVKNLVPFFKLQLKICNFMTCVPYEWDDKSQRIRVLTSKYKLIFCKCQVIVQWIYTSLMVAYFITPGSMKSIDTSNKMLGAVFLACLVCTTLLRWTFWKNKKEGVMLVNSFLEFEDQFIPGSKEKVSGDKAARILMTLGLVTSVGLASFMCFMLLVDPCKPPHLGYILYKKSLHECVTPPFLIRISILALDTWTWASSITPACFYAFHVFFLDLRGLDLYLQLLTRTITQKISKRFKSQGQKDERTFKFYRHLQLMGILYNYVLQNIFIPTLVSTAISVIMICLYACIKLHKVIPMPGFAFFPLLCCDGFSVIFITKVAAGVLNRSQIFVSTVTRFGKERKQTWYRKMVISCEFIKIRFGSTNFIDQLTPLIFMNFCFTQTVSLMLMT